VALILTGVAGPLLGRKFHFTLPPILGVLPALAGWGIIWSVYLAWQHPLRPSASQPHPGMPDLGVPNTRLWV
jgi:hypothetical protein